MAVENVHESKRTASYDPKTPVDKKPEDVEAIENEVKKARARRELVQEQQLTKSLVSPPAEEPPFKISGGINLGQIDIQEQQREARTEAQKLIAENQAKLEKLQQERDEALSQINNLSMQYLKDSLEKQIESLKGALASGNRRDIFSELEGIDAVAQRLGYTKGEAVNPDINASLQLKRLEQEIKREDRRFAMELKRDERLWQLEMEKLKQQARDSEVRLLAEKQKYEMLAAIPKELGSSIAKGLLAANSQGVSSQPSAAPQPYNVTARENEAGEIECPQCQTPVGIAPTANRSVCATCGQLFTVTRTSGEDEEDGR